MIEQTSTRPSEQIPGRTPRPAPLRVVRGPDGRPRIVRRGLRALAALQANVPRVLRVGVIRDARIVEERILRARETVTVGPSERNHFVVAGAGLPSRHPLFDVEPGPDGERWVLTVADGMTGRVAFPPERGGVIDLDDLRSSAVATAGRRGLRVPLDERCKGKIVVGDTTLLFQFVVPPPVQPRPQLPASVQGGWIARFDPGYMLALGAALALHVGLLCGTMLTDWPKPTLDEILASDFSPAQFMPIQLDDPPAVERQAPGDAAKVAPGAAPAAKPAGIEPGPEAAPPSGPAPNLPAAPRPTGRRATPTATHATSAPGIDADQLAKAGDALDVRNLLGNGPGAGTPIGLAEPFDGRQGSVVGLAEAMRNMVGVDDAAAGSGTYTTRTPSPDAAPVGPLGHDATGTGDPPVVPGRDVATQVATARTVTGTVRAVGVRPDPQSPGVMTAAVFHRELDRKMGLIQNCYDRSLVGDPTLAGDLVFGLVINQQGQVRVERQQTEPRLDVAGVTACIEQKLGSMNFTAHPPVGGDFRVRLPFSFIAP